MIISHKHKFIFFACGKTGTHSVEAILDQYNDDPELISQIDQDLEILRRQTSCPYTLKHVRPDFVRKYIDPSVWNSYFKFVFVRNPCDWVLSNFCFNYRYASKYLHTFEPVHVNAVWHMLKIHNQSAFTDNYFQYTFTLDESGNPLVDFIGKMENFQEDFNYVCSRIGVEPQQLEKKNPTSHMHYKKLYTEKAKSLVAELYKKDIELLHYEF